MIIRVRFVSNKGSIKETDVNIGDRDPEAPETKMFMQQEAMKQMYKEYEDRCRSKVL